MWNLNCFCPFSGKFWDFGGALPENLALILALLCSIYGICSRLSWFVSFLCCGCFGQNRSCLWRLELLDFSLSRAASCNRNCSTRFDRRFLWFCSACKLSLSESYCDGQFRSVWFVQTLGIFRKLATLLLLRFCSGFLSLPCVRWVRSETFALFVSLSPGIFGVVCSSVSSALVCRSFGSIRFRRTSSWYIVIQILIHFFFGLCQFDLHLLLYCSVVVVSGVMRETVSHMFWFSVPIYSCGTYWCIIIAFIFVLPFSLLKQSGISGLHAFITQPLLCRQLLLVLVSTVDVIKRIKIQEMFAYICL